MKDNECDDNSKGEQKYLNHIYAKTSPKSFEHTIYYHFSYIKKLKYCFNFILDTSLIKTHLQTWSQRFCTLAITNSAALENT